MTNISDVITFIETKVQGISAMFTAENVNTSNCPACLHAYQVAFDEETLQYELIGKNTSKNSIGTLLTVDKLKLNQKDRYMLKENIDFIFSEGFGFASLNEFLAKTVRRSV